MKVLEIINTMKTNILNELKPLWDKNGNGYIQGIERQLNDREMANLQGQFQALQELQIALKGGKK